MSDEILRPSPLNGHGRPAASAPRRFALGRFFGDRWRGEALLGTVFWWDMICVGTMINLVAAVAGMVMFASDLPTAVAALVYFSPLPYNAFLFLAVWRSAEKAKESTALAARLAAAVWLALATAL